MPPIEKIKVERSTSPKCGDKHRGPPFRTGPGPTYRSKWVDGVTISNGCLKVKVFIADVTNLAMNVSANFLTLLTCLGVQKSVNHMPTLNTVENGYFELRQIEQSPMA